MSQAQIELALFDKLETIKASLPTIYYPNSPNKNKPNPKGIIKITAKPMGFVMIDGIKSDKDIIIFEENLKTILDRGLNNPWFRYYFLCEGDLCD
jgi:hypothetical protein